MEYYKFQENNPEYTSVLILKLLNIYQDPISHQDCRKLFCQYGNVQRILIFKVENIWTHLIEMGSAQQAQISKNALNNKTLADGKNILIISSGLKTLVQYRNQPGYEDFTTQIFEPSIFFQTTPPNSQPKINKQADNLKNSKYFQPFQGSNSSQIQSCLTKKVNSNVISPVIQKSKTPEINFFNEQIQRPKQNKQQGLNMTIPSKIQENFQLQKPKSPSLLFQENNNINNFSQQSSSSSSQCSRLDFFQKLIPSDELICNPGYQISFAQKIKTYKSLNINSSSYNSIQSRETNDNSSIDSPQNLSFNSEISFYEEDFNFKSSEDQTVSPQICIFQDQNTTSSLNQVSAFVEKKKSKVLYIKGLSQMILSYKILQNLFGNFGNVVKILIIHSKNVALMEFQNILQAQHAKDNLNKQVFAGSELKIFFSHKDEIEFQAGVSTELYVNPQINYRYDINKPREVNPLSQVLHVSNYDENILSLEKIVKIFSKYGVIQAIQNIDVSKRKKQTKQAGKNMCLIKFNSNEQSSLAMAKLHSKIVLGNKIIVSFTRSKIE